MVDALRGRRALVTGAGQGIGRAAALALAAAGAEVVAASRTLPKMADLSTLQPNIRPVGLDVTDRDAVDAAVATHGPFHVLVNVAGWVPAGTILECSDADWDASLRQNATSAFLAIRAVLPGMLDEGGGAIVNVASVASSITGVGGRAAYGAGKAAVIGLTKAVARDFIDRGIRCNALCPGTTLSPSLEERMAATGDLDAARRAFTQRQPMGRLGTAEEMAATILYMVSDASAFMTGQVVVVDGGQTL